MIEWLHTVQQYSIGILKPILSLLQATASLWYKQHRVQSEV